MSYSNKNIHLSEICEIRAGYTVRGRLEPSLTAGVPAIQTRDLPQDADRFDPRGLPHYALDKGFDRYWVAPGDVLFRSRGEQSTAIAITGTKGSAAIALLPLFILRPDASRLLPEFLVWLINQPSTQRYFDSCAQGSNIRMIPKACLDELELSLPDLETQRLVVDVAALAQRERELMALLAEKRKAHVNFVLLEQVRKAQLHGNGAGRLVARPDLTPAGKSERTK